MTDNRRLAVLAALAVAMLPAAAAQAQYYGAPGAHQPPPLYPYAAQNPGVVQRGQPYAIQVAPGTYVIQRPVAATQPYPYVSNSEIRRPARARRAPVSQPRRQRQTVEPAPRPQRAERKPAKPAAAKTARGKGEVINTTRVVRGKPIINETTRYVDLPPRVIERYNIVEADQDATPSQPAPEPEVVEAPKRGKGRDDGKKRVIRADAEVTVLGPDRMTIQLFRRGEGPRARAN